MGSQLSRYESIKAILDKAAGNSVSDYQGYGKFWQLPLDQLLVLTLYGVRMIAPASPSSPSYASSAASSSPACCPSMSGSFSSKDLQAAAAATPPAAEKKSCCHQPAAPAATTGTTPGTGLPGSSGISAASIVTTAPSLTAASSLSAYAAPTHTPGRGAASGLIIALKGEFPFDGTQFQPLLWGASRVAPSDIQFISDWIDDGCPATDNVFTAAHQAAPAADDNPAAAEEDPAPGPKSAASFMSLATTLGQEVHLVSNRSTNIIKSGAGQLLQRKNVEFLNADELSKLRSGIAAVKNLNQWPMDKRSFNNWARLHGNECQHGWELFLPWHRMLLYEFEKNLQDQVPGVTLPYWDWPMKMYNGGQNPAPKDILFPKEITTPIPSKYISGIIPTPYRCYLTQDAVTRLIKAGVPQSIAPLGAMTSDGKPYAYNSGVELFWAVEQLIGTEAAASYRKDILAELNTINSLWHLFRYPAMFYNAQGEPTGEDGMQSSFHHHYPTSSDMDGILDVNNWKDFGGGPNYDESFGVLDMEPHNTIHIWTGGTNPFNYNGSSKDPNQPQFGDTLNNLTAGYDPIFYALHSNVDRIFSLWQQKWPGQEAADPDAVLPGLPYVVDDAWDTARLGYEYVLDSAYFETDSNSGIKMLKTGSTGVKPAALQMHRKAILKLHKVVPPIRSFGLRIFLNQPDANENTPVTNNDHFAGYLSFFGHGDCVGGPGHCAMPAPKKKFDLRPRGHNRPANYSLDITRTAKRLLDQGAKDLQVKLVTIGTEGLELYDHLKMEGCSINFIQ